MLLKPEERDFKTRVWQNLNKDWLEEQTERKRKKKELIKKQKSFEIITHSSQVSQSVQANSAGVMTPASDQQDKGFILNSFLLKEKLTEAEQQQQSEFAVPQQKMKSPI